MDIGKLNIIEIGKPFVKLALPQTRCFASASSGYGTPPGLESLTGLYAALSDLSVDLVVCHPQNFSPWTPRWWLRKLGNLDSWRTGLPLASMFAPQLLRLVNRKPLAVLDFGDDRYITRPDLFLLDKATVYFKRELPVDQWQVFTHTAANRTPSSRFRGRKGNIAKLAKLAPLPLGIPIGRPEKFPETPLAKTSDIFFAGQSGGASTVRSEGIGELRRLAAEGFVIDIPEARIDRDAFIARAAASHLVWSPEGYGWDCFRHYEAPMCWSVPLINQPTIIRHKPLEADVHAIYYDPEPGGLSRAARRALADPQQLQTMAMAARDHVLSHHVLEKQVEYVVTTTLARALHT
jgi:hypothetical protein